MSIITLFGFVLYGIILGAGIIYLAYEATNRKVEDLLYNEIEFLEKENLHWKRELEHMHHELVRAQGGHSCKYCDPRKKLK